MDGAMTAACFLIARHTLSQVFSRAVLGPSCLVRPKSLVHCPKTRDYGPRTDSAPRKKGPRTSSGLGLEVEGDAVHAVALPGGVGAVGDFATEVSAAARAMDL